MKVDDVDRIMAVMQAAFDPEYREAWNRRQVEDALLVGNCSYLLVGPDGEDLPEECGNDYPTAGFILSRGGFGEEELLLFAVTPELRGRGIGSKLITRYLAAAHERGAERVLLEMRRGNSAENLYRKVGFAPVGLRPNYYRTLTGSLIDAITFSRIL